MRFVLFSTLFFLLVCRNTDATQTPYQTAAGGVGAVYTMTNGATMNQILIQRIHSDGKFTSAGRVNTNGIGVNVPTGDVLNSQGALVVYCNYLFAVNPGSNSLSMFWINPRDATQLKLISVQPTFGQFPISVAVNEKYACVLTTGIISGMRCFTHDSHGLHWVESFDRNLTSYVSQVVPPSSPQQTSSDIIFSSDNLAIIIAIKGFNPTTSGYILFFFLSEYCTKLSPTPIKKIPPTAIWLFSLTLVGENGLLITDAATNDILTLTYSSTTGMISNNFATPVNATFAPCICWSEYSPTTGNYYISSGFGPIIEVSVNLHSKTHPVRIVRYYGEYNDIGAIDVTIVTIGDIDYLYYLGGFDFLMYAYRLNAPGNATLITTAVLQPGDSSILPQLAGAAAFIQNQRAYG